MKFLASFLLCLLCSIQYTTSQPTLESTTSVCKTRYGKTSVSKVPTETSTYSSTTILTGTFTSTPIVKVTPDPITVTKTQKSKVVVTSTRSPSKEWTTTLTTTQVQTATGSAITSTETDVSTTTINITTTYTYVGPSVTPVQDTIPGASLQRKRSRIMGRQSSDTVGLESGEKYPESVECDVTVFKIVIVRFKKVAPPKTVTVRPSKVTETVTSVYTSTSTVCPPNPYSTITVTLAVTSYTTIYPTVTKTTTVVATETAVVGSQVIYPQCGPRNFASKVNGQVIAFLSWDTQTPAIIQDIYGSNSSMQCCIDCVLAPSCAVSLYAVNPGEGNNYCALLSRADGVCNPAEGVPIIIETANKPLIPGQSGTISNNKCGQYDTVERLN